MLRPGVSPRHFSIFISAYQENLQYETLPVLPGQAASSRPSPVEIWQILLSRLLDQHYGLTLNDTPFADERVIEQHIEAGISLCDAVNFLVEKYALVLPTSRDSAPVPALS
ncbi:hypothetical protein ECO5905_00101 [Escherichia coli O55:H7 str. USDA 5905]|nr:hypothetical protein ECO5905_00101 [Escherichia coli O55:H7 str. USDA 5905]